MSVSIYYEGKCKKPLNEGDLQTVAAIAEKFSVDNQIKKYIETGEGLNWESFHYETNVSEGGLFKKGTVFEGSTKLPDNTEDAMWEGVQHWCHCLSELRNSLPNLEWQVRVEDHNIQWDKSARAYDPTK
jgi:hypothetical protein